MKIDIDGRIKCFIGFKSFKRCIIVSFIALFMFLSLFSIVFSSATAIVVEIPNGEGNDPFIGAYTSRSGTINADGDGDTGDGDGDGDSDGDEDVDPDVYDPYFGDGDGDAPPPGDGDGDGDGEEEPEEEQEEEQEEEPGDEPVNDPDEETEEEQEDEQQDEGEDEVQEENIGDEEQIENEEVTVKEDEEEVDLEVEELIELITDKKTYIVSIYINEDLCYLLDKLLGDGKLDTFYNSETGDSSDLEMTTNGEFLIDFDDDGDWDYVYNPASGEVRIVQADSDVSETATSSQFLPIYLMITIGTFVVAVLGYWIYHDQKRLSCSYNEK